MLRLVLTGILAALFFSSTFVLNRAMSLEGGHWLWTASLRYGWMLILLGHMAGRYRPCDSRDAGAQTLLQTLGFLDHCRQCGIWYFLRTDQFSSSYAPAWVVAATWQMTILATPAVLLIFGRRVSLRALLFTLIVFAGVLLINIEQASAVSLHDALLGALPVMGAAFAYPLGNQMLWEARLPVDKERISPIRNLIPTIDHPAMDDAMCRVLLLTLGSLPFWIVLMVCGSPLPCRVKASCL